jgi:hypothetical protein
MSILKSALIAASLIGLGLATAGQANARLVWYGPGSGPYSPFANLQGWAQFHPHPWNTYTGSNTNRPQAYRCVPNVGLVGANGVCPD